MDQSIINKLNNAHPDNLSPYQINGQIGKTTFFWGVLNQTLYTDDSHKSVHNGIMQDHPEMVREILPEEVHDQMMAGAYRHPRTNSKQIWQVVSAFTLMGRLGSSAGMNVVSIWPRSYSGVEGKLDAAMVNPTAEIPKMLKSMMGNGNAVHYGGQPPLVDESWIVTMMNELHPTSVGDLISGVASNKPITGGFGDPDGSRHQIVIDGKEFSYQDFQNLRACCHVGAQALPPELVHKTGIRDKDQAIRWLCEKITPELLKTYPHLEPFRPSNCKPFSLPRDQKPGYSGWHQALKMQGRLVHGYGEALQFREWMGS